MKGQQKTKEQLIKELKDLQKQLADQKKAKNQRKRAEEEVRTTQKMLSEAERLANAGSFQWDIAANKVTWSDGLYHIYGLKPQEFGASFEAFLNQVHQDSREIVRQTIETAYRDCKPFQMEERIVRSDGEIRVLFSKGEIITNDQGTPVRMVGSCQDVTERKKAEEARISSLEEARMARNIQVNLLPQSNPDVAGYDIAGMSIPALNVGGDYYDFIRLDDYRLAISLGDVSGKGLAASLVMSNLQATIRGQTFFEANAKGCLERANTLLFHSTDSRTFVSLFYGILDTQKNTLCYSNAGHDIPLIFSAGRKPNPLKTRGIALGLKENVSYVKEERSIHPNDLVLIYSDGISEAMNERKEEFGDKRLQEIVQHNSGDSARELIDKIIAAANLHFGNASQNDDMTIIIIKRTP